jgi:membrane protease YdiL (CAAX protease family)
VNTQKALPLPIAPTEATPWLMLFSRIALFAGFQVLLALILFLAGAAQAWDTAANWWPLTVAAVDVVSLLLLIRVFAAEGKCFWDLFRIERATIKGDLLVMLLLVLLMGPVSYLPNVWLGQALFGDPEATLALIVRPLPYWAVFLSILLFPVGQGLTELPTYFGYVMPRLPAQGMRRWLAVSLPALMLALQHIAIPLLFDGRFILWRALMFIPFAFLVGITLHWRPRLMPYMVVVHTLMDMAFAIMFLNAAY